MSFQRVPLSGFDDAFGSATELSSVALGGSIVSVSDEFFAEAFHLLLVEPAPSMKGQFGPNGALYSGWESRRHNPTYDWCIIKLGTPGTITGFDIDTSNFNGNEAPQVSVYALDATEEPKVDDPKWNEVIPKVDMGPNSRHLFKIARSPRVNYVKLVMHPDGGIARFRVYGSVVPVFPKDKTEIFDLAHVFAGGRVEYTSDQHFGVGSNLILPGRGKDMGDGWETKRSRQKGHKDWAIIRLGTSGALQHAEIDTAHFKGNFPESCEIHALSRDGVIDWKTQDDEQDWTLILPRTKLGPHRQHFFQLENVKGMVYTHIKVTIHPDGGLKRVRIMGTRGNASGITEEVKSAPLSSAAPEALRASNPSPEIQRIPSKTASIPVLPLTPEAFAPFGKVIQGYADHTEMPKGTRTTPANGGSATKFHKLSLLASSYPAEAGATTGISVYRCNPTQEVTKDGTLSLTVLERHPFTNQAFIPMGRGLGDTDSRQGYLVVVASSNPDGQPNMKSVRAFKASAAQGIVYDTGIWHQPMTVLDKTMDFACVETQIGDGSKQDCEILELDAAEILRLEISGSSA